MEIVIGLKLKLREHMLLMEVLSNLKKNGRSNVCPFIWNCNRCQTLFPEVKLFDGNLCNCPCNDDKLSRTILIERVKQCLEEQEYLK